MRRLLLAVGLPLLALAAAYGFAVSRQDASYHALLQEGDAAAARGDLVAAVEAFSGAIAWKPDAMAAHLKRGEAYLRRGEYETASRDLLRAAELDSMAPRPRELLGDVNYAMGRYPRAAERYAEYIALDDSSHRLFYKLGLANYRGAQPVECITALQTAAGMQPHSAETQYLLGLCFDDAGKEAEALRSLEQAVGLAPAFLQAREELAEFYGRRGRSAERIAQLEALLALDPGPSRDVALGLAHAEAGDEASAVEALSRAARKYPTYRYSYVALGRVWLELAQARDDRVALAKALEALQNAVGADDNGEALTLLGRALLLGDEVEPAERVLQQATGKLPVDPVTFFNLAEAADRLGHMDVAREALLDYRALAGDPADAGRAARIWLRIADLSMRLDDPRTAAEYYARAVARDGSDPQVLVRFAEAQWRTGQAEVARATLDKALAVDPANAAAQALRRRLR